jgi:hypothetical protein
MKKLQKSCRTAAVLVFFLVFLLAAAAGLSAQSNELIDRLLEEEAASYGPAVYLIFTASGDLEEDAGETAAIAAVPAMRWGIEPKDPEEPISLGEFSYLLMRALDIEGGIMYKAFPGPRYAARELKHLGFVPGSSAAGRTLSGSSAVHILGRAMEWKEGRS